MLSLLEAYEILNREIPRLSCETLTLEDAVGGIIATDLVSPCDYPTFDQSAMDGYALHPQDLERSSCLLTVTDQIQAGAPSVPPLKVGCAVRVFTGAPLPGNAAAVRIQESVHVHSDTQIALETPTKPGANIRHKGSDLLKGEGLLSAGHRIQVTDLVGLANLKVQSLTLHRKPRVLLTTSGNELVDLHGPALKMGQVVDGNRVFLRAALTPHVERLTSTDRLKDTEGEIDSFMSNLAASDLVVTCGGMSVGDFDILGQRVRQRADILVYKIAVKPGKPVLVARVGTSLFVGLPGNPVSTLVGLHLVLMPVIRLMSGSRSPFPVTEKMVLTRPLSAGGTRLELLRGSTAGEHEGRPHVSPMTKQGSNDISASLGCDCLIVRPKGHPAQAVGESVQVYRLTDQNGGTSFDQFKSTEWSQWSPHASEA